MTISPSPNYAQIEENAFSLEQEKIWRVNWAVNILRSQLKRELESGACQRIADCFNELSRALDDATHDSSFDALVKEIEG